MKQSSKIFFAFLICTFGFLSCDQLLTVDSERNITVDQNTLNNPNDTVYSMLGILNKVRMLGDRYVVLGELRGDLMDVTANSDLELRDISNFTTDSTNSWLDVKDFYAVINNCNYFINHVDTSIRLSGVKVMMPEFAQAKTIRAWTYLQLATTFGKAAYMTKPIVTLEDAFTDYPMLGLDAIIDTLIQELLPYRNVELPQYISVGSFSSNYLFLPTKFVLGDLYLWKNDYLNAATMYHELMYDRSLTVSRSYKSGWNDAFTSASRNWNNLFSVYTGEIITMFPFDKSSGTCKTYSLTQVSYELAPTSNCMELFTGQQYYQESTGGSSLGDLRGENASFVYSSEVEGATAEVEKPVINKYAFNQGYSIYLYRSSTLYLRYAEAVAQLGKFNMALSVMNNGLNTTTSAAWQTLPIQSWYNFTDARFTGNMGTRQHGLGTSGSNFLAFPTTATTYSDSLTFVEDCLRDELALETAFEGNRFTDLMRMARHRNRYALLAEAVALKHSTEYDYFKTLLMDPDHWYLPYPGK